MRYKHLLCKPKVNLLIAILWLLSLTNCKNSNKKSNSSENINDSSLIKTILPESKIINLKYDTLLKTGKPFLINRINCYWKLSFIVVEGNHYGDGFLELYNKNTDKILLSNERMLSFNNSYYQHSFNSFHSESFNDDCLEDLNFDGLMDFKLFDKEASGSAGMFYFAYIFNSKMKIFELNEELSGYELELDKINKTLSTYTKNGYSWNISEVYHFDNNKTGEI